VTYQEPERLALQLRELMERRAILRGILEQRLRALLTDAERSDIEHVIGILEREMSDLLKRLEALQPGAGGTG
jgi:hypothetical protein